LGSVTPELQAIRGAGLAKDQLDAMRAAGFTAVRLAPADGIVRGASGVIGLGDGALNENTLRTRDAQVMALQPVSGTYPGSLMGAIAVIRQAFLDARWYRDAHAAWARKPAAAERPETNLSLEALQPVVAGEMPTVFVADEMLEVLRAGALAKEAGVAAQIVTAGDDYKRIGEVVKQATPLIVPVNFPDAPEVGPEEDALEVTTEELRQWQDAPGNPKALAQAGVTFALTANGLKDVKQFRTYVGKAIARGLTEAQALAAVTTTPARLLGLEARIGTIAPGKIANLTVTRGKLFSEQGKVREVWVDGNRYETAKDETTPKGEWTFDFGAGRGTMIVAMDKDTTVKLVFGADTIRATAVRLEEQRLRFSARQGSGPVEEIDLTFKNDALTGKLVVANVGQHDVTGRAIKKEEKKASTPDATALVAAPAVMGNSEAWRAPAPASPAVVLVKNATIWTAGPAGTLQGADLLVRNGKIASVGKNLPTPAGAVVIDATGRHVAPGIIDEHSHSAILGNVNECTNSITCEVRIADVVNSESANIYRQLAGGTTMMHLLHGSCNAIGGQCAVIKNKWGLPPDQLIYGPAPPTVKFALGENPKQSNWGADATGRYPQSRAGVEQVIRDGFIRARDYRAAWEDFRKGRRALPPRRDLQLDALQEIIEGKRKIHCHSYRQDEILMLMRLTEEFGFHVNTFTHILEGYKVADEMAAHGASALGFTDWWGYKYEVIDAIPYNAYLMWDRGVNVGFNSDSDELARRLNTEAAKAVKYGGVPLEEAIKFVTINPAKSLEINSRVGSLEVGKDADFSIWSGPPMSPYSHCDQTWIEGRKYFDREADQAGRAALEKERAQLLSKARAEKKEGGAAGGNRSNWPPRYLEDTDLSGNDCGMDVSTGGSGRVWMPFVGEGERRALRKESEAQR
jgi:imidazolonepropionase-like amidohydrolase